MSVVWMLIMQIIGYLKSVSERTVFWGVTPCWLATYWEWYDHSTSTFRVKQSKQNGLYLYHNLSECW